MKELLFVAIVAGVFCLPATIAWFALGLIGAPYTWSQCVGYSLLVYLAIVAVNAALEGRK